MNMNLCELMHTGYTLLSQFVWLGFYVYTHTPIGRRRDLDNVLTPHWSVKWYHFYSIFCWCFCPADGWLLWALSFTCKQMRILCDSVDGIKTTYHTVSKRNVKFQLGPRWHSMVDKLFPSQQRGKWFNTFSLQATLSKLKFLFYLQLATFIGASFRAWDRVKNFNLPAKHEHEDWS